jgi:hypothetical protein
MGGIARQKILMIVFGRIERAVRLNLRSDRLSEHVRLIELRSPANTNNAVTDTVGEALRRIRFIADLSLLRIAAQLKF